MIIWISGPTGAGKTTLALIFQKCGYNLVGEQIPYSSLQAFATTPSTHCAALQEEIIRSRFEAWRLLSNTSHVVFDRSIEEDIHVFCEMHFKLGFLTSSEIHNLRQLAARLQGLLPDPDLIISVCPSQTVLRNRVTVGTHPPVIVNNLDLQLSLYRDWIAGRSDEVVSMDNSRCGLNTLQAVLGELNG